MADQTSAGNPAATEQPAEVSFEDALGMLPDEDFTAPETGAAKATEGDDDEENPVVKPEEVTTYSSPAYARCMSGHIASNFFA